MMVGRREQSNGQKGGKARRWRRALKKKLTWICMTANSVDQREGDRFYQWRLKESLINRKKKWLRLVMRFVVFI